MSEDLKTKERPDFTGGDHSFKNWFKIMWKNKYIHLFLVGLAGIIFELIKIKDVMTMISDNWFMDGFLGGSLTIIGILIPWAMCIVIAYKGFYQFWKRLINREI